MEPRLYFVCYPTLRATSYILHDGHAGLNLSQTSIFRTVEKIVLSPKRLDVSAPVSGRGVWLIVRWHTAVCGTAVTVGWSCSQCCVRSLFPLSPCRHDVARTGLSVTPMLLSSSTMRFYRATHTCMALCRVMLMIGCARHTRLSWTITSQSTPTSRRD